MNYFETFPECFLPSTVSEKTKMKLIGLYDCLRDVTRQSCLIYTCTPLYLIVCGKNSKNKNKKSFSSVQVTLCCDSLVYQSNTEEKA